jgi:phage virion morphogenesis protein
MSGALIAIDVNTQPITDAQARLSAANADMRDFFADVGGSLLISTRARGNQEVDPDGVHWVPLNPKYAARKAKQRPGLPILHFDGHLLGDKLAYDASSAELLFGTGSKYGASQQFGRGGIPARPFLGLSESDREGILAKAAKYEQEAISG